MFVVLAPPDMYVVFFSPLRNILVVSPVTLLFVYNIGGLRPLQHLPWGGGLPQSCFFFYACKPPADLRLYISAPLHFCA